MFRHQKELQFEVKVDRPARIPYLHAKSKRC